MVTVLFLIIAFFRRKRFLPEDASRANKVLYYILNVPLTPVFGPILFEWLMKSKVNHKSSDDSGVLPPNILIPPSSPFL